MKFIAKSPTFLISSLFLFPQGNIYNESSTVSPGINSDDNPLFKKSSSGSLNKSSYGSLEKLSSDTLTAEEELDTETVAPAIAAGSETDDIDQTPGQTHQIVQVEHTDQLDGAGKSELSQSIIPTTVSENSAVDENSAFTAIGEGYGSVGDVSGPALSQPTGDETGRQRDGAVDGLSSSSAESTD